MNFGFRVDIDEFELKGELCSGTIWPRSDKLCDWAKIIVVQHKFAARVLTLGVLFLAPYAQLV